MPGIEEILTLERTGPDEFHSGPIATVMTRLFGGQIAGQALMAAGATVEPWASGTGVHSGHCHFLCPGDPLEPVRYQVDRVRDGRSFRTRNVTARQGATVIFQLTASFHAGEEGLSHQIEMPPVPGHDAARYGVGSDPTARTALGAHQTRVDWEDWDRFPLVPDRSSHPVAPARQRVWLRNRHRLPDGDLFHAAALTYIADMGLISVAKLAHPEQPTSNPPLDHTLWIHRPFRVDEWLLFDQASPSAEHGRALIEGRLFDERGVLVASIAQEGLIRRADGGRNT